MTCDSPTPPHLLERATTGEPAALSALVCARKERAYLLAILLSSGDFDAELSSDLRASMEELADACAHGSEQRRSSRPPRDYDPSRSGTVRLDGAPESGGCRSSRQLLLRRWQIVSALCRALAALTREERALLVLVDLERFELDQAAWLLGVREAELGERLRSARTRLRAGLCTKILERDVRKGWAVSARHRA